MQLQGKTISLIKSISCFSFAALPCAFGFGLAAKIHYIKYLYPSHLLIRVKELLVLVKGEAVGHACDVIAYNAVFLPA